METTSLVRLQLLHPAIRDKAIDTYNKAVKLTPVGIHPFITDTIRSFQKSDELYKLGRTVINPDGKSKAKPMGNIVSYAKGGESLHNYGLALDFVIQVNGNMSWEQDANWMTVVRIFKDAGFTWGGDWAGKKADSPHFEITFGLKLSEIQRRYKAKEFIPGTTYIKI